MNRPESEAMTSCMRTYMNIPQHCIMLLFMVIMEGRNNTTHSYIQIIATCDLLSNIE